MAGSILFVKNGLYAEAWAGREGLQRPLIEHSTTTSSTTLDRRRRRFLQLTSTVATTAILPAITAAVNPARGAETIGLDPDCTDRSCLGVWDGLLADCPHPPAAANLFSFGIGAGCTSSQDDTPGIFSEPWDYSEMLRPQVVVGGDDEDWQTQMRLLRPTIELVASKRGDVCRILLQQDRYLRVIFQDGKTGEKSIGEWYFTPNDTTVQFRIGNVVAASGLNGSIIGGAGSLGSHRNLDRAEAIRKEMRYLKLPVLRNRQRSFFFVESGFDSFGPGSAALGPPAEMKIGEIEDGRLSDGVGPQLKIDLLQQFPFSR